MISSSRISTSRCSRATRRRPSTTRQSRNWVRGTGSSGPRTCFGRCLTRWISFTTIEARMSPQEKFQRFVNQHPHARRPFYARPHFTRRQLFQVLGAGVTANFIVGKPAAAGVVINSRPVTTQNTARNVIFVFMVGAPSHTDTFDFKQVPGITPSDFNPTIVNGLTWPMGLLPKLGQQLSNIAIVRSMQAWATGHSISQNWVQIGRNPSGALGDISPNIGSIVAVEKYG